MSYKIWILKDIVPLHSLPVFLCLNDIHHVLHSNHALVYTHSVIFQCTTHSSSQAEVKYNIRKIKHKYSEESQRRKLQILWCIARNHGGQWSTTLVKGEGAVAVNPDKNVKIDSFISISIVCKRNERIYIPSFLLHTILGSFMVHPLQNLPYHTVQEIHHLRTYLRFELMHCQDPHVVSGVWWDHKLVHQGLHKLGMSTFTCQVYSITTILQVWDTNYGRVDKETRSGQFLTLFTTFWSTLSFVSSSRTISSWPCLQAKRKQSLPPWR